MSHFTQPSHIWRISPTRGPKWTPNNIQVLYISIVPCRPEYWWQQIIIREFRRKSVSLKPFLQDRLSVNLSFITGGFQRNLPKVNLIWLSEQIKIFSSLNGQAYILFWLKYKLLENKKKRPIKCWRILLKIFVFEEDNATSSRWNTAG